MVGRVKYRIPNTPKWEDVLVSALNPIVQHVKRAYQVDIDTGGSWKVNSPATARVLLSHDDLTIVQGGRVTVLASSSNWYNEHRVMIHIPADDHFDTSAYPNELLSLLC